MASDWMDVDVKGGNQSSGSQWERGKDVSELQVGSPGSNNAFRPDEQNETYEAPAERRGRQFGGPSDPTKNLIFLGLDPELTEQEVSYVGRKL